MGRPLAITFFGGGLTPDNPSPRSYVPTINIFRVERYTYTFSLFNARNTYLSVMIIGSYTRVSIR